MIFRNVSFFFFMYSPIYILSQNLNWLETDFFVEFFLKSFSMTHFPYNSALFGVKKKKTIYLNYTFKCYKIKNFFIFNAYYQRLSSRTTEMAYQSNFKTE